jgi:hypothetical protein
VALDRKREHSHDMSAPATEYEKYHALAKGTNVCPETLLATDYLNHFNEALMLLEMVPDMPEVMEDMSDWRSKSYIEHFSESGVADRELAIAAYPHSPAGYRSPFERVTGHICRSIEALKDSVADWEGLPSETDCHEFRAVCAEIRNMIDVASAIINGSQKVLDQSAVDLLMTPERSS